MLRASLVAISLALGLGCGGGCGGHDEVTAPVAGQPASRIRHVVVVVQENHSFDTYFGRYCTAPAGSAPSCTNGPACCEAAPATEPSGSAPVELDDKENGSFNPDHSSACEADEVNGGKMDRFVTSTICGHARNFAVASAATAKPYWDLAQKGALADRYFQPIVGASSSNDMYLVRAQHVFTDNEYFPDVAAAGCAPGLTTMSFDGPTIGDLLAGVNVPWAFYAEGYADMQAARAMNACPTAPADCPAKTNNYPCTYDASDVPFQYYAPFRDNPTYMRDYGAFATDLAGDAFPAVSWVKPLGYKTEHPGLGSTISAGVAFVEEVASRVEASRYAADTLILITYDEGGGYFDHVPTPPTSAIDGQPYGTRVPLIALGPFVKKGAVSHAVLEHSSLVRFIEWNWLATKTGQLAGRDTEVGNLGSLLDPAQTGLAVPE